MNYLHTNVLVTIFSITFVSMQYQFAKTKVGFLWRFKYTLMGFIVMSLGFKGSIIVHVFKPLKNPTFEEQLKITFAEFPELIEFPRSKISPTQFEDFFLVLST